MVKKICNMCGKEFDMFDDQNSFELFCGIIRYGSKYDGGSLSLDLCCGCTDKIIDMCKISPVTNYDEGYLVL